MPWHSHRDATASFTEQSYLAVWLCTCVRACVRTGNPHIGRPIGFIKSKVHVFSIFFNFFCIPIICCLLYNHHRCTESALNRAWRTMHSYMPHAQSQMSRLARTYEEWLSRNNTIIDIQRFPTFWKRSSRKHKGKQQPRLTLVQQLWCSAAATSSPGYKRFSDIPFASDRMLQPFLNILFVYRVSVLFESSSMRHRSERRHSKAMCAAR